MGPDRRQDGTDTADPDRWGGPGSDPDDRRAVLVEAIDDSCALHSDVQQAWTNLEDHTLAGLEPAECDELTRLLAKVEANLCREAGDCPELR